MINTILVMSVKREIYTRTDKETHRIRRERARVRERQRHRDREKERRGMEACRHAGREKERGREREIHCSETHTQTI